MSQIQTSIPETIQEPADEQSEPDFNSAVTVVRNTISQLPIAGVELEAAPEADACGALGCRRHQQLVRGVIEDFGKRVLCADHMADLIRRETL